MTKFVITKMLRNLSLDESEKFDIEVAVIPEGRLPNPAAELKDRIECSLKTYYIKKVIFNSPATIVFWGDGTKTVVKCQDGDKFIPETGLAMCFMKKALGNKSNFNNTFKKWVKDKTVGDLFNELSKDEQKRIAKHILSDDEKKPIKTYAHLDTELIYRVLREHKWTTKEFADYVGVHVTSVYAWLKGNGIKKRMLNKLSKVLHIPEEDLVK